MVFRVLRPTLLRGMVGALARDPEQLVCGTTTVRPRLVSSAMSATELSGSVFAEAEEPSPEGQPRPACKKEGPMKAYEEGVACGALRQDPRQALTARRLQRVFDDLWDVRGLPPSGSNRRGRGLTLVHAAEPTPAPRGGGWLSGFFGGQAASPPPQAPAPRGLYMYGGVGVGKTMLMDIFVSVAPPEFQVLRMHFHDFMIDVHTRLRQHQRTADPLRKIADEIVAQTKVLCLDELFVTDVADASILNRLFQRLWRNGLVLIATSNRHPDALYEGGLQRDLFLPFIAALKERCRAHDMESTTDYRMLATHSEGLYFLTPSRDDDLYRRFVELAAGQPARPESVQVAMGRELALTEVAGPLVHARFEDLCGRPLGAADFIALAQAKHTLLLRGVPVFTGASRSQAYRFVTLIDVLYEHRTRLLCSAEATPSDLFANVVTVAAAAEARRKGRPPGPEQVVDDNLGFAKDRTISRLLEMQSGEYLEAHAKSHAPHLLLAIQEQRRKEEAREAGLGRAAGDSG
uniref:Lactation elevated protein 1 n=1 Tax=Auxenochlorella protothecoides TaxID=3075 RepID=A0A1D1ZMP7_AUXPR